MDCNSQDSFLFRSIPECISSPSPPLPLVGPSLFERNWFPWQNAHTPNNIRWTFPKLTTLHKEKEKYKYLTHFNPPHLKSNELDEVCGRRTGEHFLVWAATFCGRTSKNIIMIICPRYTPMLMLRLIRTWCFLILNIGMSFRCWVQIIGWWVVFGCCIVVTPEFLG